MRQGRRQVRSAEHKSRAGIAQHEVQAVLGVSRVQRQISRASFQNANHPDDHLQRPFHADAYQGVRSDFALAESGGDPVGASVQLAISKLAVPKHNRDGIRVLLDAGLKQFGHIRLGIGPPGLVPINQQSMPLRLIQQRQFRNRSLRVGDNALQQIFEMFEHAYDS